MNDDDSMGPQANGPLRARRTADRYHGIPVKRLIASWFGAGLIPRRLIDTDAGAGTVGSVAAFLAARLISPLGWQASLGVAIVVSAAAVWASEPFSAGGQDPGWVVADEAAGTFISGIGLDLPAAVVALAAFRLADIFKTRFPGVAPAENLPGGWGITADDLVAGLYGLAAGWAAQSLLP